MKKLFSLQGAVVVLMVAALVFSGTAGAFADEAKKIDSAARKGLKELYRTSPKAKELGQKAAGVLVFPKMVKGGFILGAQAGTGALFKGNKIAAYYTSSSVSYGLQIGIKQFGYAVIFMTEKDLDSLDKSGGWEIGSAPSLVVVDGGVAGSLNTSTMREGIYAFFFGKKGLMAGIGLQGTKITKYNPKK